MSADEWATWVAVDRRSPIGRIRADLRAAIIAETMANCHLGRGQKPFTRMDFMPFYEQPEQSDEEIGDAWLRWGMKLEASIARKKKRAGNR